MKNFYDRITQLEKRVNALEKEHIELRKDVAARNEKIHDLKETPPDVIRTQHPTQTPPQEQ